jgi:hypothetical protein
MTGVAYQGVAYQPPQTADETVGLHKLSANISGKHICVLVIFTRVLTCVQLGLVTYFSGHAREVRSSQMNPGSNCTGQMADVAWATGLLMSTCPVVVVGLVALDKSVC